MGTRFRAAWSWRETGLHITIRCVDLVETNSPPYIFHMYGDSVRHSARKPSRSSCSFGSMKWELSLKETSPPECSPMCSDKRTIYKYTLCTHPWPRRKTPPRLKRLGQRNGWKDTKPARLQGYFLKKMISFWARVPSWYVRSCPAASTPAHTQQMMCQLPPSCSRTW